MFVVMSLFYCSVFHLGYCLVSVCDILDFFAHGSPLQFKLKSYTCKGDVKVKYLEFYGYKSARK